MKKQRKRKVKFDPTVPIVLAILLVVAFIEIAKGDEAKLTTTKKIYQAIIDEMER